MRRHDRVYRACLGLSIALNVALLWMVEVVPGQDFPQHLAYAHIIARHQSVAVFATTYELPSVVQPYFVPHLLLAALARFVSVVTALKVVLSAYVVAFQLAVHMLVRELHGEEAPRPPWAALGGGVLVLGPAFVMGWLGHLLAATAFVAGCAAYFAAWRRHRRAHRLAGLAVLAACVGLAASVHVVVAAALVGFTAQHAFVARDRLAVHGAALAVGTALVTAGAWAAFGALDIGGGHVLDAATAAIVDFGRPRDRLAHVGDVVLGPYAWPTQLALGLGLAVVGVAFVRGRTTEPAVVDRRTALAIALFTVTAVVVPATVVIPKPGAVPTIVSMFDLRLFSLAAVLALALVPPSWLGSRRGRLLLTAAALTVQLHGEVRLLLADRETAPARRLLARGEPGGTLLPLVYSPASRFFGPRYHLGQFVSLHYTLLRDGIDLQFWARFSQHLPVGYRAGREPPHPRVATPSSFEPDHLRAATHLFIAAPDPGDTGGLHELERVMTAAGPTLARVDCEDRWCLMQLRADPGR